MQPVGVRGFGSRRQQPVKGKRRVPSNADPNSSGGGVGADGFDRFDLLPDCLLIYILSFLPIEDSVRTSVLSTRWRHLWTLAPLRILDDSALCSKKFPNKEIGRDTLHADDRRAQEDWRARAVDCVISAHAGPIRSCRLSCINFDAPLLDGWFQTLSQKGVQDISLHLRMERSFYLVPPSLITCQSLRSLELCFCRILKPSQPGSNFINLRVLKMKRSLVTDAAVNDMLANCPALQNIALVQCAGLRRIHVRSRSLCSMTLNDCSSEVEELFVVDAPNLEQLMLGRKTTNSTHVKVLNAPKLELLGFVDMKIKMLEFGGTYFQESMVRKFSTLMHSLKKLSIRVNFNDNLQSHVVFDLLRCFPCLETLDVLVVEMDEHDEPNEDFWEELGSLDCLEHHLKSVTLKCFSGQKAGLGFVNFLIAKAQVLKVMTIISVLAWNDKWLQTIQQDLCLQNKASIDAEVVIMKESDAINRFQPWRSLF